MRRKKEKARRPTRDEDDEPDSVDRDLVLGEFREETTIGKTVIARECVERTSVGLSSGSNDLESDETDESPKNVESSRSNVL